MPRSTRAQRAEATLTAILPTWRDAVAPVLGATFIDELLRQHRARVIALIERWLGGDLQAQDSSDELADRLVALTGIANDPRVRGDQGGRPLVLDPGVGGGALAAAVVRATHGAAYIDGCDIDPEAAEAAKRRLAAEFAKVGKRRAPLFTVYTLDFLKVHRRDSVNYDYVVMRPPTRRGADRKHVLKAWELLDYGGTLVALTSSDWLGADGAADVAFRDFVDRAGGSVTPIAEGVILVLQKPLPPDD